MKSLQGAARMEATAAQLQRAIDELNEAAEYFETLGMDTQRDQLDGATEAIEDVKELLDCLLGRVLLDDGPGGPVSPKTKKTRAMPKLLGKVHLAKRAAV